MTAAAEEVSAMTSISVREFSHNPSAMFSRVENGETIEVTRHGKVIAVLTPPVARRSRYDELVAAGAIVPGSAGLTSGDWDKFTHIEVPDDVDPLAILMEMREHER
jgi:antitoxin (DNA-binding transcriptional repressor) of toxin-antitoxin stability system